MSMNDQVHRKPTGSELTAKPATSAEAFLAQARDEMRDRASSRDSGRGERSMHRAIAAFNALYGETVADRIHRGLPALSETMGWQFMSVLKKARGAAGAHREDDYTDDVAYAALAAECASGIYWAAESAGAPGELDVSEPPPPADISEG